MKVGVRVEGEGVRAVGEMENQSGTLDGEGRRPKGRVSDFKVVFFGFLKISLRNIASYGFLWFPINSYGFLWCGGGTGFLWIPIGH